MANIFDLLDPARQPAVPRPENDALDAFGEAMTDAQREVRDAAGTGDLVSTAAMRHSRRILDDHSARGRKLIADAQQVIDALRDAQAGRALGASLADYLQDSAQRLMLTLDALRRRGDIFLDHEADGCPPVLVYDYEVVMEGRDLPDASNYFLLRIKPPAGYEIFEARRPFIIIDPRAGHGSGIGGFKTDSQVGVALRSGHAVYFVGFHRDPVPGQTLADVTRTEAEFVREVTRRHPKASRPVVIGNCQGGWATLLLAATNPDLTGPVVVNGAPVATWSGEVGSNPMRYNAGVLGGTWIPMLLSDLGAGVFDGANLVQNFELLNPARTLFRKYADLYLDPDRGVEKFLEFETWWGGFFLLNEEEIRWIVEQLFIGNRLVKNEARLEPGRNLDLKVIQSPIIVFASRGDNITPPQQALNWIIDTYADVAEIRIRGQRIVYMIHDQVGHLGIFVSSQIANREHTEVASTLQTIESLAPGLYEMKIDAYSGDVANRRFTVSFAERTLDDLRAHDDGRFDERPFAAVARSSELQAQAYELLVRPLMKMLVSPTLAEFNRAAHPMRLQRALWSSRNPATAPVRAFAGQIAGDRRPAPAHNPFVAAESLWFDMVEQAIDLWRDQRDMLHELSFFGLWSTPWMRAFGKTHEQRRTLKNLAELRSLPEVRSALYNIERGGFVDAVIRMLVLLAESRGDVRRDRLERSSRVLTQDEPFRSLTTDQRALIIREQTLIATYERERAIETLPMLLTTPEERELAARVVQYVPGAIDEMTPHTLEMLQRFHHVLGFGPVTEDVADDPLATAGEAAATAETAGPATGRAPTGGPETGGPETGGPETGGPETGGAETGGAETREAGTGGAETGKVETGKVETGKVETGATASGTMATGDAGAPAPGTARPRRRN